MFHNWKRFSFHIETSDGHSFERTVNGCPNCGAAILLPKCPSPAVCVMRGVEPDCSVESVKSVMTS